MEENKKTKKKRPNKIVPEITVTCKNEPNMDLMARAYITFYHKTKHYM